MMPATLSTKTRAALATAALAALAGLITARPAAAQLQPPSTGDRLLGLDVSAWQTEITTTEWATLKRRTDQTVNGIPGDGRDFVFIRASRGGTTGYYNQSNAGNDNPPGQNTLSQRYDDPYFIQNITRATGAGLYAGTYHFGRPDIIESTLNSGGIRNNGTDEADHFLQMAGPWMRPGYLPPVFDLEAGISQRTGQELAQFSIDFSDRIFQSKGIRPAIYINGSYAQDIQNEADAATRQTIVQAFPTLWIARWPNQANPDAINVQTTHPKDTISYIYGPWDDYGTTHPWNVWQYASTARLYGNNNKGSNTDVNVVQGNIEYLRDMLIPAVWMNGNSGNWADLANWNSGQTPVAPVQGPGQVARVGAMRLPGARLPGRPDPNNATNGTNVQGVDDTVNLIRPNENITVTFDSTVPPTDIRRLNLSERLVVTGSSLNVQLTGYANAGGQLAVVGGATTIEQAQFNTGSALEFGGPGTLTVGSLVLSADVTYNGAGGMGLLTGKTASSPMNLGGATRTFNVGNGTSAIDLRVALPVANGNLTKTGAGTLHLTANNAGYSGNLTVADGVLLVTGANQIGSSGVVTTQTSTTVGGTVRLEGGFTVGSTVPLTLGGLGASGGGGALLNAAGNNTWAGTINLAGTNSNQGQQGLNQIGAESGTTLTLSGVIKNAGASATSWAKTGAGDVVLAGSSPNTYTNLTRIFGGRLIIEKNGALGSPGSNADTTGNTFQLPGSVSTLAFRSATGLNYSDNEWIHTEGTGVGGLGQIDNLDGDNVFAGHLGLGGPTGGPLNLQQASIGVSADSLEIKGGLYARTVSAPEARHITKLGAGTLILSGDSGPAPTNGSDRSLINSTFSVNAGTVALKGTAGNTANVPGVTNWEVGSGATLRAERVNATGNANVNLLGGTFQTTAGAGAYAVPSLAVAASGTGGTVDVGGTSLGVTGAFSIGTGKTLTKNGAGSLDITAPQSHGAGAALNAGAGVTNVNTNAGSTSSRNLAVNVAGAGTVVNFNAAQHLAALTIAGGARANLAAAGGGNMLVTNGLTIDAGGVLNTGDNDLLVDYAAGSQSPYKRVAAYAVNAFLGRPGGVIRTGEFAPDRMLAVSDNVATGLATWNGQQIDLSTVIGRYLYFGDTNYDGSVTLADYAALDASAGNVAAGGWRLGDYTYDGQITYMDYAAIDANLGKGIADDPSLALLRQDMIDQHAALYGDPYLRALAEAEAGNFAYLFGGATVPEPSTGLVLLGAAGLLAARGRRTQRR